MKTMAATKAPAARPLSPHLQIYKPMLTMTMSIVHRITGIGNYFGTLLAGLVAHRGGVAQFLRQVRMVRRLDHRAASSCSAIPGR